MIKLKSIYDKPEKSDGHRVLFDRVWPEGISKREAKVDLWLKIFAPSEKLLKWFSHDVSQWQEFKAKYLGELAKRDEDIIGIFKALEKNHGNVTILFSKKDDNNNAAILYSYIKHKGMC